MNAEAKFVSSVMDARLKKVKQQRDTYKKQRDELINDIADIKRKAEAFDEVAVTVLSEDNDVIKNMNNIVTKIVINNLERGSDDNRN
ncbi:hypothetical protein [Staphylococcus phage StB20]|uniref:hypothetical protein n=1 Tax=Staphylococcus phage StB20 TaxID=1147043 RepID=UPI0002534CDD|nr:hypothetical protein G174_gp26 [Staphylococcus phage StB20]AFD22313.1 hypothetical protein [Staphylococcus phage StB20]